jgi:hypothetical protein
VKLLALKAKKRLKEFLRSYIPKGNCLLIALKGLAEELIGKVIKVSDGDTITVLDSNNQKHKIRLKGIDAPESQQVWRYFNTIIN